MERKYVLTVSVNLDTRDARDDVEARNAALNILYEWLGSTWATQRDSTVKLQQRFPDRPPRNVELSTKGETK